MQLWHLNTYTVQQKIGIVEALDKDIVCIVVIS